MQLRPLGKGSRTPGPRGSGPGTLTLFEEVTKPWNLGTQNRDQRGGTKVTGQPLCLMPQGNSTAWSSWAVPHLPGHPRGRCHAGPPPTAGEHSPLHGPRSDRHHALRAGSESLVDQVQDPGRLAESRRALCLAGCLRAGPLQPLLALQTPSGRWGRADTQDEVPPLPLCPPHVALG